MSFAGAYDLSSMWAVQARLWYAANVPTLCAGTSDCLSSVGRDIGIVVGSGRTFQRRGRMTPHVDLAIGWEWLTSKLSDSGVTATRSWNGPLVSIGAFLDLSSRPPWTWGPALTVNVGVFSHAELQTPAWNSEGATDPAIHAWPTLGFRVGRQL